MEDNKVKFCLLKVRHIDNTETKKKETDSLLDLEI